MSLSGSRTEGQAAAWHGPGQRPAPARGGRPEDGGFALLVVLWSVALLAVFGVQIAASGRAGTQLASNIRVAAELEAAADAGLHEAIFRLLDQPARRWKADGTWRRVASPRAEVDVLLESLDGRINPNIAQADLLSALFRQVGAGREEAYALAVRIQEWRVLGRWPRTLQVKTEEYRAAGRDYAPPGAAFRSVDELLLVLGMTPELFAKVQPHLSVHTGDDPDRSVAHSVVQNAMTEAAGPRGYDNPGNDRRTVAVTAAALGKNGARFVRRAVVAVRTSGGQPWRVLALEDER